MRTRQDQESSGEACPRPQPGSTLESKRQATLLLAPSIEIKEKKFNRGKWQAATEKSESHSNASEPECGRVDNQPALSVNDKIRLRH